MFWKDGLSKKIALEHELSGHLCYQEKWYLFFPKIWHFSFRRKVKEDDSCSITTHSHSVLYGWRWSLSKNSKEIWFFLYIWVGVTNMTLPSRQKKQRCPCPEKIHLRVTSPASPRKMIFIQENMVFLLKHHIEWHPRKGSRSSYRRCSTRKGVLRNFENFTGEDLCQSLFFNKVTFLRPTTLLKKWLWRKCFSVNCFEISKSTLFTEHTWATASGIILFSVMETFIDVFINCFLVKKSSKLIL